MGVASAWADFEIVTPGSSLAGEIAETDLRNPAAGFMDEITLAPGSAESVTVTAHSEDADLVLEVMSPTGHRWLNDDRDRTTVDPSVTLEVEEESDHLIRLFGLTPRDVGSYTLRVD